MLQKRHLVVAGVVLVMALGWGCGSSSLPSPSLPSRQSTTTPPVSEVTHTLTMTASPSCTSLPAEAMTRTYPVQVTQKADGTIVVLVVNSNDRMVGWANAPGFSGTRNGDAVRFPIADDLQADYAMIERISGVGDLGYAGTATGTIGYNASIVAAFSGDYTLASGNHPSLCHASDHRLELVPAPR